MPVEVKGLSPCDARPALLVGTAAARAAARTAQTSTAMFNRKGIAALHPPNSGASFTVPVGGSTLGRARGKLARVRRAAPRPARHPLGGSAHVLVRRGAVIQRRPWQLGAPQR